MRSSMRAPKWRRFTAAQQSPSATATAMRSTSNTGRNWRSQACPLAACRRTESCRRSS